MHEIDPKVLQAFDTILSDAEKDVARLSEPDFRTHLLPVLASEHENTSFEIWLEIAGEYRRPIDVFDPKTGEVLFRVPALVGDVIMVENESPENSAFEVAMNASRKAQVVPKAGNEYLRREMSRFLQPTGNPTEAQRIWNDIFARYGIVRGQQVPTTAAEPAQQKPTTTLPAEEVEGYDEI